MPPQPIRFGVVPPSHPHQGAAIGGNRYVLFNSKRSKVDEATSSPAPPSRLSANKRRKAAPIVIEPAEELMSMTMEPLNVTIVARCVLAHSLPPSPPNGSSSKKRSHRDTPTASPTPPIGPPVHPYSRHSDLANTRSTIPSPHELARAERMEEERARQKKENAAAARAAAALARRRRALRSGGRNTPRPSATATPASMIPPIQRAVAAQRARSAEAAAAEAHAAEAAAAGIPIEPEDDGTISLPHRALKRTRSSNHVNGLNGNGTSVGSPLRTVTNGHGDDDNETPPQANGAANGSSPEDGGRKRSRLAESTLPPQRTSARRAASASPQGTAAALPDSSPRKGGASDPTLSPEGVSMRRAVSAQDTAGIRRAQARVGSAGPEVRERSRREVQLPARLRE